LEQSPLTAWGLAVRIAWQVLSKKTKFEKEEILGGAKRASKNRVYAPNHHKFASKKPRSAHHIFRPP
jgi:hypothetical protein